jgi:hypothetical protein
MKDLSYYTNIQYQMPQKSAFTTVFVYERGEVLDKVCLTEFNQSSYPPNAVTERIVDEANYKNALQAYYAQKKKIYQEFQDAILAEFKVTGNPRAILAIEMACQKYSNFRQAYEYFEELLPLVK